MHQNSLGGDCIVKKFVMALVLAAGVTLAVPTAANAATCGAYGLTQSANTAAPGAVVTVTSCFAEAPGTPVTTSFTGSGASDLFDVTPAVSQVSTLGPTGAVTFKVTVPSSAVDGSAYVVSAATAASTYSGTITVVAPASSSPSGLASTGLDLATMAWVLGGLLVAAGAVFGILGFRRARHA